MCTCLCYHVVFLKLALAFTCRTAGLGVIMIEADGAGIGGRELPIVTVSLQCPVMLVQRTCLH